MKKMLEKFTFVLLLHTILLPKRNINVEASLAERSLLDDLFRTYSKHIRPVTDYNNTVHVEIKHTLSQILNVNERKELFVTAGWCTLRWRDAYLAWNPGKYNGIRAVNMSPGMIWIPDIILFDDFKSDKGFGSHVDQVQNRLTVDYSGNVTWGLKSTFVTKCHFNINFFPFDRQTCPLKYGSWSHQVDQIDISPTSRFRIDYHATHNGWDILRHASKIIRKDHKGEVYAYAEFDVTFKRKAILGSLNLIMPPVVIGTLVLLSFVLPAASGERLALSITLLLAMIFFFINVTYLIPNDNVTIPVIYKFFIFTLGEIVLQIVAVIFSMQLYHKKSYDPPMPEWMRQIFLVKLPSWTGKREYHEKEETNSFSITDELESITEIEVGPSKRSNNNGVLQRNLIGGKDVYDVTTQTMGRTREERILKEWRLVALAVDRCLFALFLTAWTVTVLSFFCMVTKKL